VVISDFETVDGFFGFIMFATIASIVQLVEMIVEKYTCIVQFLGNILAVIAVNCSILEGHYLCKKKRIRELR
jgi:Na+-transporting NADH:ubiquinone oxidoreductase subunit NqrE